MSLGIGSNDFIYKLAAGMNSAIGGGGIPTGGNENTDKSLWAGGFNPTEQIGGVSGGSSGVNFTSKEPVGAAGGSTARYDQYDTHKAPAHASFVEGYDNQVAKYIDLMG